MKYYPGKENLVQQEKVHPHEEQQKASLMRIEENKGLMEKYQ